MIAAVLFAGCGSPGVPAHAQEADLAIAGDAAPEPATIDGCQVIARIDSQVVLACEILWRVNQMLEANQDRIPPGEFEAVRDQLMKRTLVGMIDQKLLYAEFRRNIPPENMPRIEESLRPHFEEKEVPRLMEQLNVKSQRELALELTRLGSSLDDARQSFNEHVIASEWIRSKIKVNDDVSPDEMVKYYHDHRKEFEYRAKVRWEELTVRKSGIPAQAAEAYAKLAQMGNEVWPRVGASRPDEPIFGDVAKSKSEGFNANDGGLYDWTRQGTLKAEVVDKSLFALPVGQMSTILDSGTAFHIVRVLERAEAGCRPFSEVQNDIRDKLKDERMAAAQKKYLNELRKNAKIWTVYSGNVSVAALMGEIPGQQQQR